MGSQSPKDAFSGAGQGTAVRPPSKPDTLANDWKSDPEPAKACDYLPIRMREVAYYESPRPRDREEREAETAHDLNVSIQFGYNAKDQLPTITCGSRIWLKKRMRELWGAEAMVVQGWPFKTLVTEKYIHQK